MRYLIFSDIHGNLEALNALLQASSAKHRIDHLRLPGRPRRLRRLAQRVIQKVRALRPLSIIRGNHDKAVMRPGLDRDVQPRRRGGDLLDQEDDPEDQRRVPAPICPRGRRSWTRRSPSATARPSTRTTTSSANSTRTRPSITSSCRSASSATPISPSSTPRGTRRSRGRSSRETNEVKLEKGVSYLINPGLGRPAPRPQLPGRRSPIYDSDAHVDPLPSRSTYDIADARIEDPRRAELPPALAERLSVGI